jgi:hypothetical protein
MNGYEFAGKFKIQARRLRKKMDLKLLAAV